MKELVVQDLEKLFQLSAKDTQKEEIFLGRKRDNLFIKECQTPMEMLTRARVLGVAGAGANCLTFLRVLCYNLPAFSPAVLVGILDLAKCPVNPPLLKYGDRRGERGRKCPTAIGL